MSISKELRITKSIFVVQKYNITIIVQFTCFELHLSLFKGKFSTTAVASVDHDLSVCPSFSHVLCLRYSMQAYIYDILVSLITVTTNFNFIFFLVPPYHW